MLMSASFVWLLSNKTPYAAERNWTRDEKGVHWWLVAVRATFEVDLQGRLHLADEQLAPILAPEHLGEPGDSSLLYDSDLLDRKPACDIIVLGSAHAPHGKAAASVPVVLRVGPLEKQLVVHGERVYYEGLTGLSTTKPLPFISRPIQYELAFGGRDCSHADATRHRIDERNPVGRGFGKTSAALANAAAHAIEYPSGDPARRGPAGFGAIDRGWLPRRKFAGTYDAKWVDHKKPLLPDDYRTEFAMGAPADQRLPGPLVGGERVGLLNMSPQGALVFELPRIALVLTSRFARAKRPHDVPLLATLLLEPEHRRVSMVWQSCLRVAAPEVDFLDETKIEERPS